MPRKSRVQIDGESALRNLNEIHQIVIGDGNGKAYHRNAGDCARWVRAVKTAKMEFPQWMYDGNIKYFASIWGFIP